MTVNGKAVRGEDLTKRQRELFWDVLRHNESPDKQQSRSFTFRVREFDLALLKAIANTNGDSPSETARIALSIGLSQLMEDIPEDLQPGAGDIALLLGDGEGDG